MSKQLNRNDGGPRLQLENCARIPDTHKRQILILRGVPMLGPRKHSLLARNLIVACGGLEEAATACRLGKSQLSNAQNVNQDSFLPIDVVAELEAYCGEPIISRALFESRPSVLGTGDLVGEAIDLNAQVAALSSHLHHALSDKIISANEADQLGQLTQDIRNGLARIEADLKQALSGSSYGKGGSDA